MTSEISSGLKWGRAQTSPFQTGGPVLYLVHLSKYTKLTNIFENKVDFSNILYKMHYSGLIFINALKYGQMHEDRLSPQGKHIKSGWPY